MNRNYKVRFAKSRVALKKFQPPTDPLEQELSNRGMEPRQDWYNQKIIEYIQEYSANQRSGGRNPMRPLPSSPNPNPYFTPNVNDIVNDYIRSPARNEQFQSPMAPDFSGQGSVEADPQQDKAYQDILAKIKYKTWGQNLTERARKEYTLDFISWLNGKSELNLDLKKTPWGRHKLVGPGISEYVEKFIEKKTNYELAIQKLRSFIPSNIDEAWLYYKFIASKPDLVSPNAKLAHNGRIDPDAYDWDFFPELDWWLKSQQGWTPANPGEKPLPDQLPPKFDPRAQNSTMITESMNRIGNTEYIPTGVDQDTQGNRYPKDRLYFNRGDPGPVPRGVMGRETNPSDPPREEINTPRRPNIPDDQATQELNPRGTFLQPRDDEDYSYTDPVGSPTPPSSPSYAEVPR